jgi:Putative metallopeptidase
MMAGRHMIFTGGPMKSRLVRQRHVLPLLLFVLTCASEPIFAQSAETETELFQARVSATAQKFGDQPGFKNLSAKERDQLAEFVTGNVLFVLLHELGHAAITQMGLPVLGRQEDAADSFAATGLIRIGSGFTHRVLAEAAKGWFLADRRDQETNDAVAFYDEHGLNQQRAYEIVCLMVGSDEEKFRDLAAETKLPKPRQETCAGDFSNAAYSWDLLLKPHLRAPDQPETKIDVVYGDAKGRLEVASKAIRSIGLLEAVAQHTAEAFVWPAPFTLEMQSCGFPNARWDFPTRKLTVCYELAADFAELYRAYGAAPVVVAKNEFRKSEVRKKRKSK